MKEHKMNAFLKLMFFVSIIYVIGCTPNDGLSPTERSELRGLYSEAGTTDVKQKIYKSGMGMGDETLLHFAALDRSLGVVKFLVEQGADVDAKNQFGQTPLMNVPRGLFIGSWSDYKDRIEIARFLVAEGANVNARDDLLRETPLHKAAANGHLGIVKFLIEKGADPNITDKNGETPLDITRAKLRVADRGDHSAFWNDEHIEDTREVVRFLSGLR